MIKLSNHKKQQYSLAVLLTAFLFNLLNSQTIPTEPVFNTGQDPKPNGQQWVLVDELSDEFNDDSFDTNKWSKTSSGNWIGRPPGLFEIDNVSESGGDLRIKARKLPQDVTINGDLFTHGGGYVESVAPARPRFTNTSGPGLYFECRMLANKTFMSSTFWLNNLRNEADGCQRRVTELDIQECVGTLTGTSSLALRGWDRIMHSNAHSRNTSCPETPTGSAPQWKGIGENVSENYHIYGAWWKSPREVICYLDGVEFQTVVPKADFDLNLYLRLVVETYDWNPTPADGGMNFTELERSTLYDWVRTWKLEDPNVVSNDVVSITNAPESVERGMSFDVEVYYEATSDADIVVALYDPTGTTFYKNAKKTVSSGTGTVTVTIQTEDTWPVDDDYDLRAIIRDVGGNFQTDRETTNSTIDLKDTTLSVSDIEFTKGKDIAIFPNPAKDYINVAFGASTENSLVSIYDLKGNLVFEGDFNDRNNVISLEALQSGVYIVKIEGENQNATSTLLDRLVVQ